MRRDMTLMLPNAHKVPLVRKMAQVEKVGDRPGDSTRRMSTPIDL